MLREWYPFLVGRRTWVLEFLDGVGAFSEIVDKGKLQVTKIRRHRMNMFTEMAPERQQRLIGEILGNALIRLMMEEQKDSKNEDETTEESKYY